jgi:2-oxoglutarate ferredoxin oxidoreductase subunit gamma
VSHLEIRIAGTGGQGLILAAKMLAVTLASSGRHLAQSQTYEPTSRGGFCASDLIVSDREVDYPLVTALDCLVLLDALAVKPSLPLARAGTLVIADERLCPDVPDGAYRVLHLPLSRTGLELGSERVTNIVALGALAATTGLCERDALTRVVGDETPHGFRQLNLAALEAGWALGETAARRGDMPRGASSPLTTASGTATVPN